MKSKIICLAGLVTASSLQAEPVSIYVEQNFTSFTAQTEGEGSSAAYLQFALDYNGFGADLALSRNDTTTDNTQLALRYDFASLTGAQNWNYGVVGGISGDRDGDLDAQFYGVELGYHSDRFQALTRLVSVEIDDMQSNWRGDLDLSYQITGKWSAFFDYTHFDFDESDFQMDDYLVGVKYNVSEDLSLRLGYGEVHPTFDSLDYSNVWSQVTFSIGYQFGGKTKVKPMRPFSSAFDF